VLLTDGYDPYAIYAHKTGITHAQCWAHYLERRGLFEAQDVAPSTAAQGLNFRWDGATGYFAGPSLAPSTSASCKA
jgi:hypothetical protein